MLQPLELLYLDANTALYLGSQATDSLTETGIFNAIVQDGQVHGRRRRHRAFEGGTRQGEDPPRG